jgi:F-type H+/Na+-transporting ATPase subunit alpha
MKSFETYLKEIGEIGFVEEALPSLAYVSGIPTAHATEIVQFETGEIGQVLSLSDNTTEILVFAKYPIRVGTRVVRTNQILEIPVGKEMIGKILDPFGNPLDKFSEYQKPQEIRQVDIAAPGIVDRKKIDQSFETGVTIVDMLIPLGRGQRELVLGDRKTGKTNFLLQTLLHQARLGTLCIYVAIGKKKSDVKKVEEYFLKYKIMDKIIIMVAGSEDPTSSIYITPYSAMSLAEYFKDQGHHVLLVLDDLTTHAKFYREISLLGKKFPGRNAYPADIFYTHAKLLERAGNFKNEKGLPGNSKGESSITCLPVVETIQGDITGYIQTNIMSMTDGHIYFDNDLFTKGRRPAINPFLSVTRVGRQTQTDLERTITRELISFLTLREKIENFAHFGAEVNASIKEVLITGEKVIAFFEQSSQRVIGGNIQTFVFTMVWFGIWRNATVPDMNKQIEQIITNYETNPKFHALVEEYIAKADSLNTLLGMIRDNLLMITTMLGLKLPPNPMVEALLLKQSSPTPPATGLNALTQPNKAASS